MTRRRSALVNLHRRFGRRAFPLSAGAIVAQAPALSDEARLFALTFAGGFLFMTVYLA